MRFNQFQFVAICASAVLPACNEPEDRLLGNTVRDSSGIAIVESASPEWTRSTAWRVDTMTALVIGNGEAIERMPLDPVSVFRTEAGEIVIADGNQVGWHNLLVYDSRGRWLRTVGRKGEGPCEFQQVWWAAPYRKDSIAVFDMARQLVHVFGPDGTCGGSIRVPRQLEEALQQRGGFASLAYAVYPDGTLLTAPFGGLANTEAEGPSYFMQKLIRVERSGDVRYVLGEFEVAAAYWDGQMVQQLYYGPFAIRVLDGYNLIYGTGRSYEIQRIDSSGKLAQIMRRVAEPQQVTRRDQERMMTRVYIGGGGERGSAPAKRRSISQRIEEGHWAEQKPFYRSILVDEGGNVWVEDYRLASLGFDVEEQEPAVWSVFSPGGAWLGTIRLPARFFLRTVYHDAVFGIWQDEDGVKTVRSYQLIKPE